MTVTQQNQDQRPPSGADPAQLQKDLDAARAQIANFAAQRRKDQEVVNKTFLDGLVKDARLPAGLVDGCLQFMAQLDDDQVVEFAGPDGKTDKLTLAAQFKRLLAALPQTVSFGRLPPDAGDTAASGTASFAAPVGATVDPERLALHNRVLAHQARHPNMTYEAALAAVGGGH